MARVGPFPLSTPPVHPGVYLIEGWQDGNYDTYSRFNGKFWEYGGAHHPAGALFHDGRASMGLNDTAFHKYKSYRWYGVDEETSKGQALTTNALAPHSGGPILPYVIVGFGDGTWGIMDGRTGHYALFGDQLRLFSRASWAEQAASRYVGPDAVPVEGPWAFNFWFGPYLGDDGKPRGRQIL